MPLKKKDFYQYLFGKISKEKFLSLVRTSLSDEKSTQLSNRRISSIANKKLDYAYGIKPDFDMFLNDPSGFFKFRAGIKPYGSATLWRGGSIHARFDMPLYSDISSSNEPLPDAVRSDYWTYVEDNTYSFERLLFDQAIKINENTFARLGVGYFEKMYAGTNGEILTFIGKGNLAVGIEGDYVFKREQESCFDLKDFKRHALLGNFYYRLNNADLTLHAQYGRFLAGDIGLAL